MPLTAVKSATGGLGAVVQTIAVPREHRALRIPSFPALERTSVLAFTDTTTINGSHQDFTPQSFALIRDPVFPLWRKIFGDNAGRAIFREGNEVELTMPTGVETQIDLISTRAVMCTASVSTWPVPAVPLYSYSGVDYIPSLSANFAVELTFDVDPGVVNIGISGRFLDVQLDQQSFTAANVALVMGPYVPAAFRAAIIWPLSAAFALTVDNITVTNSNVCTLKSVLWGSTTSDLLNAQPLSLPRAVVAWEAMLPMTTAPEYISAPVVWQSTRSNSAAVLISNVSAVMQKEGTVVAARVSSEAGTTMFGYKTWGTFASVHPKERYFGPLEKGLYTYTLPDAVSETYHEYDNVGTSLPVFKHYLDGNRFAHLITMTAPDEALSLAITVDRHTEFKTSSVLFPYGFSDMPLESYHQAQMALANLGVFYENPTHLATIANLARQAAVKYGPRLVKAALPYAVSGANRLLSTVNKKLGMMQQAGFTSGRVKNTSGKKKVKVVKKKSSVRR